MIIPVLLLLSLGIAVIYSSSPILAVQQLIFALIGVLFYLVISVFDYRSIKPLINSLYFAILFLLFVTLLLGIETRGSVRWIPIGPFNFQPSEFAKPILILKLAEFWSKKVPSWRNIAYSLIIYLPICLLIFRQPDLGTTLTTFFIWLTMLMAANISLFKVSLMALLGLVIAPFGWLTLQTYQKQRLLSFLSPAQDPQGVGFHAIQSMIAVGSGQLLGRGLGRGTQSRLQFLPEFRTDFIFAFIAEELGLIGAGLVLVFYVLIFYQLFKLLSKIGEKFGELIIVGVMSMLFFQITINIGMNTGLLPVTGITLPLLSYGGSSVITVLICIGLTTSIARFGLKRERTGVVDFSW